MSTKYDYGALRTEYVQAVPRISYRALAEKHGMPGWSALSSMARKEDWDAEREAFQRTLITKEIEAVTDAIVKKRATITADALDVIHAAVFKMASDMTDHWVTDPVDPKNRAFVPGIIITPDSLSKLLDRLLTLTGSASVITETRNVDLTPVELLPPDIARLIADVAGERAADARPVGRSALPGAKPASQN